MPLREVIPHQMSVLEFFSIVFLGVSDGLLVCTPSSNRLLSIVMILWLLMIVERLLLFDILCGRWGFMWILATSIALL